jgi:hypothetical protein
VGVIVPGAKVPAVRTRRVTFVDGVVEAGTTDAIDTTDTSSDEIVAAHTA